MWKHNFKNAEAFLSLLGLSSEDEKLLIFLAHESLLNLYYVQNRLFLYIDYIDYFLMETRHFTKDFM